MSFGETLPKACASGLQVMDIFHFHDVMFHSSVSPLLLIRLTHGDPDHWELGGGPSVNQAIPHLLCSDFTEFTDLSNYLYDIKLIIR